jgi:hypothetical protein
MFHFSEMKKSMISGQLYGMAANYVKHMNTASKTTVF